MDQAFDEAYARYLSFLAKLDTTEDITEKNVLFRQLTEQLSELESRLQHKSLLLGRADSLCDDPDLTDFG